MSNFGVGLVQAPYIMQWEIGFLTTLSLAQLLCRSRWSPWAGGLKPTWGGGTGAHLPPSRSWRRKRSLQRSLRMRSSTLKNVQCSEHSTQKIGRYQVYIGTIFSPGAGDSYQRYLVGDLWYMQLVLSCFVTIAKNVQQYLETNVRCSTSDVNLYTTENTSIKFETSPLTRLTESRSLCCSRAHKPEVQSHAETDQSCPWV